MTNFREEILRIKIFRMSLSCNIKRLFVIHHDISFVWFYLVMLVLGHFEWVFDGFGSFHILVTRALPRQMQWLRIVSSSFNSIRELKIGYAFLQTNLVFQNLFKYIRL